MGKYTFDFISDAERRVVLAEHVESALPSEGIRTFIVADDASDTASSSAKYSIDLQDCANTIVVKYRKNSQVHHAAVVVLGSKRIDVNGSLKAALQAQRISFAERDFVLQTTEMEYGGVTVFGLPATWPVLVDSLVMDRPEVVMGAGIRTAKLFVDTKCLLDVPNVAVASVST